MPNDLSKSKFVLGCAQLGMRYGITNYNGKPNYLESQKILSACSKNNVQFIDTAMEYGDSEEVIGKFFESNIKQRSISVITKISPVKSLLSNIDPKFYQKVIFNMVQSSCFRLNVRKIDFLLVHSFEDLMFSNGVVLKILKSILQKGLVDSIGVSIQSEQELEKALKFEDIKLIQLPFNILDSRWDNYIKVIREIKKKRGLIIHARSIFLQGLLLTNDHNKWKKATVDNPKEILESINRLVSDYKKNSIMQLCIDYVKDQDWIDGLVIGVNSEKELLENFNYFYENLRSEKITNWELDLPKLDSSTLNPSNWQTSE